MFPYPALLSSKCNGVTSFTAFLILSCDTIGFNFLTESEMKEVWWCILKIKYFDFSSGDHSWNYFVYSQWWPQSQCYYKHVGNVKVDPWRINEAKFTNSCVPTGVDTWTIHGLWPTVNGTPSPSFCNNSWHFDENEIQDLKPKMMTKWLSFPDTSESNAIYLWKHEWEKHGTCAASLPALSSQHKYFFQALALNLQYNLLKGLGSVNIVPSDSRQYDVDDVENAIRKTIGTKGRVVCIDGPDDVSYLGGIRFCLDKNFNAIDCLV
ncbi:hypothetical protein QZH41_015691, partial [Actinostola sp. cb2023]